MSRRGARRAIRGRTARARRMRMPRTVLLLEKEAANLGIAAIERTVPKAERARTGEEACEVITEEDHEMEGPGEATSDETDAKIAAGSERARTRRVSRTRRERDASRSLRLTSRVTTDNRHRWHGISMLSKDGRRRRCYDTRIGSATIREIPQTEDRLDDMSRQHGERKWTSLGEEGVRPQFVTFFGRPRKNSCQKKEHFFSCLPALLQISPHTGSAFISFCLLFFSCRRDGTRSHANKHRHTNKHKSIRGFLSHQIFLLFSSESSQLFSQRYLRIHHPPKKIPNSDGDAS